MWLLKRWMLAILLMFSTSITWSHGFIGNRFFPSAITIDEPFITDKIALLIYNSESNLNGDATWQINPKLEYAKSLTKNLQVSVTSSYLHKQNEIKKTQNGFDNWEIGTRYNIFIIPKTEAALSLGLNSSIGGSGSRNVEVNSYTTLSPELLYAQGFGVLPESLKYLKPLGVTMSVAPNITTEQYKITSVSWGMAVAYSLPYLQQFVKNFNYAILNHIVPIIEFPFTTCTAADCRGKITGNIDPGIIVYNKFGQIAIEAIIPSNANTGNKVGGVIQFYLYLDAIFPHSLGRPLL